MTGRVPQGIIRSHAIKYQDTILHRIGKLRRIEWVCELSASPPDWPTAKRLRRAVQAANLEVYQKGVTVPELRRMATTLTVTAIEGRMLLAAHVGDCRLLLDRERRLTQLTKDHTRAWQDPLAPPTKGSRNGSRDATLCRSLGHELVVSIDFLTMELAPGDRLVQCGFETRTADAQHDMLDPLRQRIEARETAQARNRVIPRIDGEYRAGIAVDTRHLDHRPSGAVGLVRGTEQCNGAGAQQWFEGMSRVHRGAADHAGLRAR